MTSPSAPDASRSQVAIIGAGMAGLGAALALQAGCAVTLVEKSRGPSGRAATRRRDGFTYDFGANFIDLAASDDVRALVESVVPKEEFVAVEGAIWTHDAAGRRAAGRDAAQQRYSFRNGINRLGHGLLEASGATMLRETHAERVTRQSGRWYVEVEGGEPLGPFEAVVVTPPAPQAAALLTDAFPTLSDALASTPYKAQFSVVLALSHRLVEHEGIYAYLNTDRAHPIAWLSFESCKAGHVPAGREALVVQMASDWTQQHYDADRDEVARCAAEEAAALLAAPLKVDWHDVQRWRYALPDATLDASAMRDAERDLLFIASDAVMGKGRVAGALQVGLETGERVAAALRR